MSHDLSLISLFMKQNQSNIPSRMNYGTDWLLRNSISIMNDDPLLLLSTNFEGLIELLWIITTPRGFHTLIWKLQDKLWTFVSLTLPGYPASSLKGSNRVDILPWVSQIFTHLSQDRLSPIICTIVTEKNRVKRNQKYGMWWMKNIISHIKI